MKKSHPTPKTSYWKNEMRWLHHFCVRVFLCVTDTHRAAHTHTHRERERERERETERERELMMNICIISTITADVNLTNKIHLNTNLGTKHHMILNTYLGTKHHMILNGKLTCTGKP